jgi:hypothetical protein
MTVSNTGFMLDRLGQDCAPLQYLRELTQNGLEAILATEDGDGEIIWDVDWPLFDLGAVYKLCVIDTGTGMTGPEMEKYINQLSSSVREQSFVGNFGVGAKIAAATRNHAGLIYQSWKDGEGAMVHLWREPTSGQYGLRQFELPDGTFRHWVPLEDSVKPAEIGSHGTKVILLGNDDEQNTMSAPEGAMGPSRWVARYLNTRYFRFPKGISVKAREGWENPRADHDRNVLRTVIGQAQYLEQHSESAGVVELDGARAWWWILKDEEAATQNSGFIQSTGHVAGLYQDELYEMMTGRSGVARLQLFGVLFGFARVVIYVEPNNGGRQQVTSNTARTSLLIDNEPLPWTEWAAEFRSKMPEAISQLMERVTAGSTSSDHRQAIRERLRQIRELFKLSRYRLTSRGSLLVDENTLAGGERNPGEERERKGHSRSGGSGGSIGNIYALFISPDGKPAETVRGGPEPEVKWVSTQDQTREPGYLEDRAATYKAEQNLLLINGDFRVFTDMVNRWASQYPPAARETVQEVVREWFEQALIECVLGAQSLRGSKEWDENEVGKITSEEGLTASVLPRYHIDVAIKRALGGKLGTTKAATAGSDR